jgi:hypothetical protein
MRNTADMTDGKPITVLLQSISGVSAINPLVAFYDIHGGKREVLFFYFVPDTTRDYVRNDVKDLKWHHNRPLILLSGVSTICFLIPFSSITHLHAHSFYSHVILHTVHPSFLRATSARVPFYIHTHHSYPYMTFIHLHNMAIKGRTMTYKLSLSRVVSGTK